VKLASAYMKKEPTTKTVLELNDADPKKGVKPATELLKKNNLPVTDENIFIVAACNDAANGVNKGLDFLLGKAKCLVEKKSATAETHLKGNAFTVNVGGETFNVELKDNKATVNGETYDISVKEGISNTPAKESTSNGGGAEVKAPMPGVIMRFSVAEGASVQAGQTVIIIEAMKMEMEIKATAAGKIHFTSATGDQVQTGNVLALIK
ncbi:MAG: hypothetical protein II183_00705, partial [Elusimicrobiaceae bacterium]|nr:hypothetical protein [Elusimicrobiaceae bacterium]